MAIQFGFTNSLINSQYAPVAALGAYYQTHNALAPLEWVVPDIQKRDFSLPNQLTQVLLSIFIGCEYISMVNTKLRPERRLAQLYRIECFAHQATLSRSLDGLTQLNLSQLERAVHHISYRCSRTRQHDWRGFLHMDFDLSGLPCGAQAEGSTKGYFSGKKTSPDDNSPVSVR